MTDTTVLNGLLDCLNNQRSINESFKEAALMGYLKIAKSIEHECLEKALSKMLDEHEAIFDREGFSSLEFANDYLEGARLLPKRTGNRIIQVENWINER